MVNVLLFSLFLIQILTSFFSLSARSFIYPVGSMELSDGSYKLFVIYQKSTTDITLLIWDPVSHNAYRGLPYHLSPAGFKMLPSRTGFSFIDKGIIRVKRFGKRPIKSIYIYEPLYDIALFEWLNDDSCYISARKNGRYGIYQLHASGQVTPIIDNASLDALYPQKIDNNLFYIERSPITLRPQRHSYRHKIVHVPYPLHEEAVDVEKKETVVDFGRRPLVFLRMVSPYEGFVLEHQPFIQDTDDCIECALHHFVYQEGRWNSQLLFCFFVPAFLILDTKERLYESLLPLLPYHHENTIYYVDSDDNNLNIFSYDMITKQQKKISSSRMPEEYFFAPCVVHNKVYYGLSLSEGIDGENFQHNEGFMTFELPEIEL